MDVCHQHKLQAEPVGRGGTAGAGGAGAVPAGGSGHAQILGVRHQAGAVPCMGQGGYTRLGQWAVQFGGWLLQVKT